VGKRKSLSGLRNEANDRAQGMCEWPKCGSPYDLEMAHLIHRGMGGSPAANVLSNVAMLCRYHHDIFDGRSEQGRKKAVADLLRAYLDGVRE
jgi:5-methylcytosine-specific restriction endonuclease McrA